jgi:hypothetical protein
MTTELDILKNVCQKLNDAKIPYMLTGSFAANCYAIPRMTRDIDIFSKACRILIRIISKNG